MTRLSGIRLLAVSFVLWALAVWFFGAPRPVETEEAATETAARMPGETTVESGTGANESAGTEAAIASSSAAAIQGVTVPPEPNTGTGDTLPQSAPERTGVATSPTPSAAGTPEIPAPSVTGTASGAGSTIVPRDSTTGGTAASARGPDAPPAPAPPQPWFEHPSSRPPLPARPEYSAAEDNAVEAQLNAARRAAWEGRFADALTRYRAAARLRPDDYVVWGELGNVLWTMQRWSEAAYALEGAATLLVRAGELRAASELVPAVGRIDPDAAYRVQRLLWTATQRQSG